jgi:hypothetical protein
VTQRHTISLWARRAVSIVAAYLIALQMVLAGAMSAQMAFAAPSDLGFMCADADGGTAHETGAPKQAALHKAFCAVCAFTAHAAPLPSPVSDVVARRAEDVRLATFAAWAARDTRLREPRSSQGPPANA